ncbi:TonB-dependent iron siderophore receptor protein [Neisseria meningitidis]|nr:TonB-dependent iron siderophore receptor protein [Neisseria meningitidis]
MTAHYKIGKSTRIGLDFENVFNKRYRTMPDIHVYGTPRSLTATVNIIVDEQKSGQGDKTADSINSTARQGEATPYWFLLIHYKERNAV